MTKLVIVESPTKAKTIRGYLPAGYHVEASMGHIRDLPANAEEIPQQVKGEAWARIGVNVEKNFEPLYVIPAAKRKTVAELKKRLKDADELILAPTKTARAKVLAGIYAKCYSPRCQYAAWSFTRLRARPSKTRSKRRARSISTWCTPRRPGVFWIA